jgi:hypothetical protein
MLPHENLWVILGWGRCGFCAEQGGSLRAVPSAVFVAPGAVCVAVGQDSAAAIAWKWAPVSWLLRDRTSRVHSHLLLRGLFAQSAVAAVVVACAVPSTLVEMPRGEFWSWTSATLLRHSVPSSSSSSSGGTAVVSPAVGSSGLDDCSPQRPRVAVSVEVPGSTWQNW